MEARAAATAQLVRGFSISRSEPLHPTPLRLRLHLRSRLSHRNPLRHRSRNRPRLNPLRRPLLPQAQRCRAPAQAQAAPVPAAQARDLVAESGPGSVPARAVERVPAQAAVPARIIRRRRRSSSFRPSPRPRRCADIISRRTSTWTKREMQSFSDSIRHLMADTTASCAMYCWL